MISIFSWIARLFTLYKLSGSETSIKELKSVSKLPAKQKDAATSIILDKSAANSPSRVARRTIAKTVTWVFIGSCIASVIATFFNFPSLAEHIQKEVTTPLEKPFMIIMAFYFGNGIVRDMKTGIMGMFK